MVQLDKDELPPVERGVAVVEAVPHVGADSNEERAPNDNLPVEFDETRECEPGAPGADAIIKRIKQDSRTPTRHLVQSPAGKP